MQTKLSSAKESLNLRLGSDLKFPIQGNFDPIAGLDLLLQDVQILLLTVPGERVGNPTYGCNLRNQIWENIDAAFKNGAAEIKAALGKYEPRVTCTGVTGTMNRNTGLIMYKISFIVNATNTPVNLVFPFRVGTQLSFA